MTDLNGERSMLLKERKQKETVEKQKRKKENQKREEKQWGKKYTQSNGNTH